MTRLNPLSRDVPIVDAQGQPTPEFMVKWAQQTRVNKTIPELSTAAQVSAVLDAIGGTAGDMLRRGATLWDVIAAATGTTKFLRADGTWAVPSPTVDEGDINLSDVLTNNVSSARHGFAPKLSGTATEYLNGSGQWSTPAGGGGGGGQLYWPTVTGTSSSGHATKGGLFTPAKPLTVSRVGAVVDFTGTRDFVFTFAELSTLTVSGIAYQSAAESITAAGADYVEHVLTTPLSLTVGKTYAITATYTGATASTSAGLNTATVPPPGLPYLTSSGIIGVRAETLAVIVGTVFLGVASWYATSLQTQ